MSTEVFCVVLSLCVTLIPLHTSANPEDYWCPGPVPTLEIAGIAYVAIHEVMSTRTFVGYAYLEQNGIHGLQRGGTDVFGWPDPCQDSAEPDLFVTVLSL